MRTIKFRAWDKRLKRFLQINCLNFNNDRLISVDLFLPDSRFIVGFTLDEFELMQFTGLKDKNGKEIYEGDIAERDDERKIHEIVFEHGLFKEKGTNNLYSTTWNILGNIYENPELITAKKP